VPEVPLVRERPSKRNSDRCRRGFALPDVSSELADFSGTQTFDGDKIFAGEFQASGPVATIGTVTYGLGTGATASGAPRR
jgi:hypothetical protein